MDKTLLLLLLLSVIGCCTAVQVGIYGDAQMMKREGSSLKLVCHFDKGLEVILDYTVSWMHVPSAPAQAPETKLTEQESVMEGVSDQRFGIKVEYNTDATNVTLSINGITSAQDGDYICRANPTKGGDVLEKMVKLLVPSDIQTVQLDFDGEEVTSMSSVAVQREEGEFGASCRASGFSPSASLQLFLDDELLEASVDMGVDSAAQAQAGAQRFQTSVSIKKLALLPADNGKTLRCVGQAVFEGAREMVASLPLEIIALEPVITCSHNSTARPGDRYHRITCRVNHARVVVDHYSFEIGDSGEIVRLNETDTFNKIIVTPVSGMERTDDVTLMLYEVEAWHIDTTYYLDVFLKNGQRFRVKAQINEKDSSGSSKPVVYVLCLLLSALVWSL